MRVFQPIQIPKRRYYRLRAIVAAMQAAGYEAAARVAEGDIWNREMHPPRETPDIAALASRAEYLQRMSGYWQKVADKCQGSTNSDSSDRGPDWGD